MENSMVSMSKVADVDQDCCQSCLKTFNENESKLKIGQNFVKTFLEITSFEINLGAFVCTYCHNKFAEYEEFERFLMFVKEKHQNLIENESINNNDQNTIRQVSPKAGNPVDLQLSQQQSHMSQGKKIQTKIIISNSREKPLKYHRVDFSPSAKSEPKFVRINSSTCINPASFLTEPIEQSSSNDEGIEKLMNSSAPNIQIQDSVPNAVGLTRRYTIAPNTNEILAGSLKIKKEKEHDKLKLKVLEKPKSFKCIECDEAFTSYYYLRKHKEMCEHGVSLRCKFNYCRFRASNMDELDNHASEAHLNQKHCKNCNIEFDTPELYREHEAEKHQKKVRARKQKFDIKIED